MKKLSVIIDTDIGSDIDDTWALSAFCTWVARAAASLWAAACALFIPSPTVEEVFWAAAGAVAFCVRPDEEAAADDAEGADGEETASRADTSGP